MKKLIMYGVIFVFSVNPLYADSVLSPKDSVTRFIEAFKKKDTKSYMSFFHFPGSNPMDKMPPEMKAKIHEQLSTVLAPWFNSKILSKKETEDYALVTAYELLSDNKKSHNLYSIYLVKVDGKWKISPAFSHLIPKKGHREEEFKKQVEVLKKWYEKQIDNHTSTLCPRLEVAKTEIPYMKKVTLSPGCALNVTLPNKKNLAIWCEKTRFSFPEDSDLSLSYGEKPFKRPESTRINLPDGGYTLGSLKSYIRQGSVKTWSSGPGHEYTIFIDDLYRVILREEGDENGVLPLNITVNMATEEERIRPEKQVEYLAKQLKHKDPHTRIKAIEKLQSELMLGDTYAIPKWQYIIDKIKPLDKDIDPHVQKQAVYTLRVLGDADSIMKVITPEPRGKFLTFDEALGLGQFAIRCKKTSGKEMIFNHVKTFFDSKNPDIRAFAIAFFAYSEQDDEVKKAIREARKDPSPKVRKAVVFALEQMDKGKGGEGDRAKMLQDNDPEVIVAALVSSVGRGSENEFPIAKVKGFLKSENKKIKLAAIGALKFKDNKEAEKLLLPLTYDQDNDIRVEATSALSGEKSQKVYKRMLELLKDKNQLVKIRALQNLYYDDYVQAIPEIKKFLKSENDRDVVRVAKESLNHLIRLKKNNKK